MKPARRVTWASGAAKGSDVVARHELVGDGPPSRFFTRGLTIFQKRPASGSIDPLGLGLAASSVALGPQGDAVRVVRARRVGDRVHLVRPSSAAPSTIMSSRTLKKCWWMRPVEPGRDQLAVRRLSRRAPRRRWR